MKDRTIRISKFLVHLSDNTETAETVGGRYGKPVVLRVASERMHKVGYLFFRSDNGVWLTERVLWSTSRFATLTKSRLIKKFYPEQLAYI